MKGNITVKFICFLFIFLFAYTALSKLSGHALFYAQLLRFPWLSAVAGLISWVVPLAEVAVVLLLFFPATVKWGLYTACLLLVLFTVYLVSMIAFKTNLPCSCGGLMAKLSWKEHIIFNLFFTGLSIVGIYFIKQPGEAFISEDIS